MDPLTHIVRNAVGYWSEIGSTGPWDSDRLEVGLFFHCIYTKNFSKVYSNLEEEICVSNRLSDTTCGTFEVTPSVPNMDMTS